MGNYFVTYTATPKRDIEEFSLPTLQYDLPVVSNISHSTEIVNKPQNWRQSFDGLVETYPTSVETTKYQEVPDSIKKVISKAKEGKFYSTSSKKYESLGHNLYKHKCTSGPATFYKDALGIELNGLWWNTGSPKTATATNIDKAGFTKTWNGTAEDVKSGKLKEVVKPGDILISYGTTGKGRNSAHAQMWDGEKWISDTIQDSDFVYAKGRRGNESALLYRNYTLWAKKGGIIKAQTGWATYTPSSIKKINYIDPKLDNYLYNIIPYIETKLNLVSNVENNWKTPFNLQLSTILQTNNSPSLISTTKGMLKGSDSFEKAYDDLEKHDSSAQSRRLFFTKLAKMESGFNSNIINKIGATGYFLFMPKTLLSISGVDLKTFANNPELLLQSALKLYNEFLKGFNKKDKDLAKKMGYSESALVAGAWLGGVGGVKAFLYKGQNRGDGGTTIKKRMDEFNNM